MSFKSLMGGFLVIWLAYWMYVFFGVTNIAGKLKPVTLSNAQVGHTGPIGLSKNFYIKTGNGSFSSPHIIKNSSDTTRVYTGLTLAKLLFPMQAINKARVITFYALPATGDKKVIHFAATAGTEKASGLRLIIDVCSYVVHKLIVLHIILFVVFISLKDIYKKLNKADDKKQEIDSVYNQSGLSSIIVFAYVLFFVITIL
jgi:hypothetical protein